MSKNQLQNDQELAEVEATKILNQNQNEDQKEKEILKGLNDNIIPPFQLSLKNVVDLAITSFDRTFAEEIDWIVERGGVKFLEMALLTSFTSGVPLEDPNRDKRIEAFTHNKPDQKILKSFCKMFYEALNDFTLKILIAAAIISIIIEMLTSEEKEHAWIEGTAILVAVFIVSIVTAVNDYQKQKQFNKLDQEAEMTKRVNVIRGGIVQDLHNSEVLVGDVCILREGMEIPADGLVIEASELSTDESAMTGETDPIKKNDLEHCKHKRDLIVDAGDKMNSGKHDVPSPILFSGTNIMTGEGKMVVIVVGKVSSVGRIQAQIEKDDDAENTTPLQEKLEKIATDIGKFGLISCIVIFIVLMIRFFIERIFFIGWDFFEDAKTVLGFFIICITVVVVAIPEGLPLSVTLSLAFSVKKMLKDNNLVRKLEACETMGGADSICSDKTGTLTENKMKVQMFWNNEMQEVKGGSENEKLNLMEFAKTEQYQDKLLQMCLINSTATLRPQETGNKTEIGFLRFFDRCDMKYEDIREKWHNITQKIPFSSDRKRMSTIIEVNGQVLFLLKGASEIVVKSCSKFEDKNGNISTMDDAKNKEIQESIVTMARQALRTIAIAYKPWDAKKEFDDSSKDKLGVYDEETKDFILCGIFGINDIIRTEVPDAVKKCQKAGIKVRMVTGDNPDTAKAIAIKANLITDAERDDPDSVMLGATFIQKTGGIVCRYHQTANCECPTTKHEKEKLNNNLEIRVDTIKNGAEFDKCYKKLCVMARSRPDDKYALVAGLIERGHVVAVTGDGTNDAPALKKADVGFAMGIAGTQVAKAACDIMLLDDNFTSIVSAIKWGRNIYDCIQKFLQFQLTVNVVAVAITFIGSAVIQTEVLTPLQMLWVNLIMDTFASLALATEPPVEKLLDRMPTKRDDYIITKKMFKHIIIQSIYQLIVLLIFLFTAELWVPEEQQVDNIEATLWEDWREARVKGKVWLYEDDLDKDLMLFEWWYDAKYSNKPTCDKDAQSILDKPQNCKGIMRSGRPNNYTGTQIEYEWIYKKYKLPSRHFTLIFACFVFMQIFNFVNARKIKDEINIFEGIHRNMFFLIIVALIVVLQFIIIFVGGYVFHCYPFPGLSLIQFIICIIFGIGGNLVSVLIKLIVPDSIIPDFLVSTKQSQVEKKPKSGQNLQRGSSLQNNRNYQPIPAQE